MEVSFLGLVTSGQKDQGNDNGAFLKEDDKRQAK